MPRVAHLLGLLVLGTACPTSPGLKEPPTASTTVTVGGYTLVPRSTFMFDVPSNYWTTVEITDHRAACDELGALSACRPESWVGVRGYADSAATVRTALVMGLGFSWPPAPQGLVGTPPGTYVVSTSCQFPFASGATSEGGANAAFIVHDEARRVVLVDEAVGGTVVLEAIVNGRHAAGSYQLALESGAEIRGEFAGDFCSAVAAHVQGPCCPEPWTYGYPDESCTCGGLIASSTCTQAPAGTWSCECHNVDGSTTTCTLPSAARIPRGLCSQRYVTCCPMCP
jgi:hypothetical protein